MHTATKLRRRPSSLRPQPVQNPRGVLHPRVQRVGPEHFGIVSVDCAKARSKWMLTDFYGNLLVAPSELPHVRGHFDAASLLIRATMEQHALKDLVIAIERTGNYHLPVKRAFSAAGFECRIVHPLASKRFRETAHPGVKTDDYDLAGIFCAATCGFGLLEPEIGPVFQPLRLWVRHRRDLVEKRSMVCCQLREHWEATLPGFGGLFSDFLASPTAVCIARHFASPESVVKIEFAGLQRLLRDANHRFQPPTLQRVLAWARTAPAGAAEGELHRRIALILDDDRQRKTLEIQAAEREIAALLVKTPYVRLLVIPGINVASCGDFAAEMGPIAHYAHANAITGRAGLFPSRYQSDQVDLANGALVRCANRRLRAALLTIADNLLKCNHYFRGLAEAWKARGKDPRDAHVKVASRFSRLAYLIVAGDRIVAHRCLQQRGYVLDKLLTFHQEHQTSPDHMLAELDMAIQQLPAEEHRTEALPLQQRLQETFRARRRGPQPIGEILPLLLAKLGVHTLQSSDIGVRDLNESPCPSGHNALVPSG